MPTPRFYAQVGPRDIVITCRSGKVKRISDMNGAYMPLKFPLLFPYGDLGWHAGIDHVLLGLPVPGVVVHDMDPAVVDPQPAVLLPVVAAAPILPIVTLVHSSSDEGSSDNTDCDASSGDGLDSEDEPQQQSQREAGVPRLRRAAVHTPARPRNRSGRTSAQAGLAFATVSSVTQEVATSMNAPRTMHAYKPVCLMWSVFLSMQQCDHAW